MILVQGHPTSTDQGRAGDVVLVQGPVVPSARCDSRFNPGQAGLKD